MRKPLRRILLAVATTVAALLVQPGAAAGTIVAPADTPPRPNIVVILADDLGYGDPRCINPESKVPTPAIDRLAREGMRFTDSHSPSAVCTPTRYGLLTGRYAWRTRLKNGVLVGRSPALIEPGRMTVASFLKGQGYATACVGKWHLGLGSVEPTDYAKPLEPGPRAAGFDEFFGIPASLDMDPYVFVEDERVVEAPTARTGASGSQRDGGAGFWRAGPMAPSFRHADVLPRITERAVSLIERRAKETRPFFLYFALTAPHTPWLPSCEFAGKSGAGPYGDFVAQTDASVGKVLDALDRTGLAAGTLLVFTSDNGAHWLPGDIARWGHRANGPLRGQKADIHEGGHRVPFIVRWPGKVQAGSECSETICHLDLLSTFAAVLGAELPRDAGEDSFSILPALLGGKLPGPLRQATVHHSSGGLFAIRQGPWKLVVGRGSGGFTKVPEAADDPPGQLYHLERDPGERENLYRAEPAVVSRLTEILDRYRREGRSRP